MADACPICGEQIRDDHTTVYWGQVKEVHEECHPTSQVGVGP